MRLQHAKRVKSKSRPGQRKPMLQKPGQQRLLVVDRVCGHCSTLTGGFLRASTQRPDGASCLALPMDCSIGKANSARIRSSGKNASQHHSSCPLVGDQGPQGPAVARGAFHALGCRARQGAVWHRYRFWVKTWPAGTRATLPKA